MPQQKLPQPTLLTLTNSNYYSPDADRAYMSNSLYKVFLECEAQAMAKISGEWSEEPSEAMLIGSYTHALVEDGGNSFRADHPEMFKKNGEPYAAYVKAEIMADAILSDDFARFVLQGEYEKIIIAEFAGCTWKAKLDVWTPERFADLKTVAQIRKKQWDAEFGWVSFVEGYGYLRQLALYAELERIASGREEWLEPLIVAVSKEDIPDKEVIGIDADRIRYELDLVVEKMPRILSVRSGGEEPKRCGTCKYCRSTKRLGRIVHYTDLLA